MRWVIKGVVIIGLTLVLLWSMRLPAATPTYLCPGAVTGSPAPACAAKIVCAVPTAATDEVRVTLNGKQVWAPYNTLSVASAIANCQTGAWSTLAALGIPVYSAVPPITPPTLPPPVTPTTVQSVTVTAKDNPNASALFPGLPVPECFTLSSPTQTVIACLPPSGASP